MPSTTTSYVIYLFIYFYSFIYVCIYLSIYSFIYFDILCESSNKPGFANKDKKKKKKKIECCHLQEGIELLEFNFENVCAIYTKAQVSERKKKD